VSLGAKNGAFIPLEMSLKVRHSNKPAVQELVDVSAVNGVA
jgi:hypothetical protein